MTKLNVKPCANGALVDAYFDSSDDTIVIIQKDGLAAGYIDLKEIPRPLQKPLTMEEACESEEPCVYLEMRNDRIGFRGYRAAYSGSHVAYVNLYERKENEIVYRALILDIGTLFFSGKDYGDKWRCWATKPTQEEREAAKWK